MVSRGSRKDVDRSQAEKYRRVGASLLESARALTALASEDGRYGNAIGVIAVHACIAYNDALTIAFRGLKSTEGDHTRAADTLLHAMGSRVPPDRVRQIRSILAMKDRVSYGGNYYTVTDAGRLVDLAEGFCGWAEVAFDQRPPSPTK